MPNLPNIKKKQPHLINPKIEEEKVLGKEMWSPSWSCYCCEDTGYIASHLIKFIYEDYKPSKHLMPICNRCGVAHKWYVKGEDPETKQIRDNYIIHSLDDSVPKNVCDQLHVYNRECWEEWKKEERDRIMKAQSLTEKFVDSFGREENEL